MTATAMEIRHNEAARYPLFGLDIGLRDALSAYVRLRWPTNTAKYAAREWGLTLDEAKGVVAGRTSLNTLEKVIRHKPNGFAVGLALVGAVAGQGLEQFMIEQRKREADDRARRGENVALLAEVARDLPALLGLGARDPVVGRVRPDRERRSFDGRMGRGPDR